MDTSQKLCILHLLDLNKEALDKGLAMEILTSLEIFKPLEIDLALGDLIKNGLIEEEDTLLQLKEEGLVVLEFFRDRIELNLQEEILQALQEKLPKSLWTIDYDRPSTQLFLSYQREGHSLLNLNLHLEASAYELIKDNLNNLGDEDFVELKKFFLKK